MRKFYSITASKVRGTLEHAPKFESTLIESATLRLAAYKTRKAASQRFQKFRGTPILGSLSALCLLDFLGRMWGSILVRERSELIKADREDQQGGGQDAEQDCFDRHLDPLRPRMALRDVGVKGVSSRFREMKVTK